VRCPGARRRSHRPAGTWAGCGRQRGRLPGPGRPGCGSGWRGNRATAGYWHARSPQKASRSPRATLSRMPAISDRSTIFRQPFSPHHIRRPRKISQADRELAWFLKAFGKKGQDCWCSRAPWAPGGPWRPSVSGRQIAAICFRETDSPPIPPRSPPFPPTALFGGGKGCGCKSKNARRLPRLRRPFRHFANSPPCRGAGPAGHHAAAKNEMQCAPTPMRSLAQRPLHRTHAACERAEQTPHSFSPNALRP